MQRAQSISFVLFLVAVCGCNGDTPPQSVLQQPPPKASESGVTSSTSVAPMETRDESATNKNLDANSPNVAVAEVTNFAEAEQPKVAPKKTRPAPKPTPDQLTKWAVPDFKPIRLLTCYDDFDESLIAAMAIHPDGKQFALGGVQLTLWNTDESKPIVDLIADLKGDAIERPIRSAAFSPDGQWLAAGDQKGVLRVWQLSDRKLVHTIRAHDARLIQLAFSPNSQTLATTSYSGEVVLWQIADGKKLKSIKMSSREIEQIAFLSDKLVATAGSEASIWNIDSEQKENELTPGYTIGQALGFSEPSKLLAFTNSESKVQFWDIERAAIRESEMLYGGAGGTIAFSDDGKWIAARSSEATIRIWDAKTRQTVQVIDADGGQTVDLAWLPKSHLLIVASANGRVRIWGDEESAKTYRLTPLDLPEVTSVAADASKPLTSTQLRNVIDVRSFPTLPGATPQLSQFFLLSYTAPCKQAEAELFYRYHLAQAGWEETTQDGQVTPGLIFQKNGCQLNVSIAPSTGFPGSNPNELNISLNFAGNYDVRSLPKHAAIDSKNAYAFFSTAAYRTKASLTEVEVSLLKQFHELGWTGYTRLAASSIEDPVSRTFSLLQAGEELIVSIGYPADSTDELFVQTSVSVKNKSLPIPSDSGWIEFDSSTDMQLVANTKMDLNETIAFYDKQMTAEGWLARKPILVVEKGRAFLPYIQGQRDVLIRMETLPNKRTRIMVGEAESSSWQLAKPVKINPENAKKGIEAAEFQIPSGATSLKFDIDGKQIHFDVPLVKPIELAEQYAKTLEPLGWTRDKSGVVSDDYVLASYLKGKTEIEVRVRLVDNKNSSVIVEGDGLLWTQPLPAPPVRVSYGTWLRRERREASLDLLDEFEQTMNKIAPSSPKTK
jgi:WD40 repeat protein